MGDQHSRLTALWLELCAEGVAQRSTGVLAAPPAVMCPGASVVVADQAAASWCWWSLRRLWVAVRRRHSDLTADLPRRKKRLAPRFDLICPKTGSTLPWRFG